MKRISDIMGMVFRKFPDQEKYHQSFLTSLNKEARFLHRPMALVALFAWIDFAFHLDPVLHPEFPELFYYRMALSACGLAVLVVSFFEKLRGRGFGLLYVLLGFSLLSCSYFTGRIADDAVYVSGLQILVVVIAAAPLSMRSLFIIYLLSAGLFLTAVFLYEPDLSTPAAQYSMNNLVISYSLGIILTFFMHRFRFNMFIQQLRLEEARVQSEIASRAKGDFLANMSHEIRTPINGIIGMTEIVLESPIQGEERKHVGIISREASALLEIINNILDFSKIEAGKVELETIPFNLRILFENIGDIMGIRAEKKGLRLITFLHPSVPENIVGDPGRLRQVIVNLAANALKFTHKGEVHIRCDRVADEGDEVTLRFSVKDTGIGIPEDKLEMIFESFTQADESTTRQFGGTGLGTAIARQLVELMGGDIGVESEKGEGSEFWFSAMFKRVPRTDGDNGATITSLNDYHVLIVADQTADRFLLTEYVHSFGCTSQTVTSAAQAMLELDALLTLNRKVDLFIIDLTAETTDTIQFARQLKENDQYAHIALIVVAGDGTKGDGRACREIGVEGYINKPVSRNELFLMMKSVLGVSRDIRPPDSYKPLITRHSLSENFRRQVRVLLVEDYPTNQQVALKHLQGAGYTVDLAEDGEKAVRAFSQKPYDIILMDIQMPVMDGYEATREIRAREEASGKSPDDYILIVAMTAHVMKGYREKCLDAKMNDYVSKPLTRKNLIDVVDKHTILKDTARATEAGADAASLPPAEKTGETAPSSTRPMNYHRALEEFEDDVEFLKEILEGFVANVNGQIDILEVALAEKDGERIRKEAHAIKGGAANLTALELSAVAAELESLGRENRFDEVVGTFQRLKRAFADLKAHIEDLPFS